MGGMQLVINTTFDDANTGGGGAGSIDIDETMGVGFRYEAKAFSVYVDMIDTSVESIATPDTLISESATKIGGTFTMGSLVLGAQIEQTEDLLATDYTMVSANYSLDKNNAVYFSYGTRSDATFGGVTNADTGSTSMALMYNHNMSKNTNLYVGYGTRDSDVNAVDMAAAVASQGVTLNAEADYAVTSLGMRVKF